MKQKNLHDITYRVTETLATGESPRRYCDLMWKYASYGAFSSCSYNHHFQKALEIIGYLYSSDASCDPSCSDHHNGICYIAQKAGVSKQEVKSLSKTIHKSPNHQGIYAYKASYRTDQIIEAMIAALKAKSSTSKVKDFLKMSGKSSIRDSILGDQLTILMDQKELVEDIDNFKQARFLESTQKLNTL